MSIQPLWLTYFIEILLVLEFQLIKTYFGTFSYKAHFRPQISSNDRCNIHQGCHIPIFIMVIVLFINGYIALWHSSMVNFLMALSHCNIHWRLRWIETFHHCTFLNGFVALQHSSRVMLDFDVHKGIYWITTYDIYQYLCWIATFLNSAFLNGFVALGHSSQQSKHLFMDVETHAYIYKYM